MPRKKVPASLLDVASRTLAINAFDVMRKFEETPDEDFAKKALNYFRTLPSVIVHQITDKSVEKYVKDCQQSGLYIVDLIQNGHFSNEKCLLPRLSTIYGLIVSSNVTHLDFTQLTQFGTFSPGVFQVFHRILSECLCMLPNLQHLNLKSPNSRTCLPSMTGDHLRLIGKHCSLLRYLDISFNHGLKGEDLLHLVPQEEDHNGCPHLETLYMFQCGFSDATVKVLVTKLPKLCELGHVELGTVIKKLHKDKCPLEFNFTHVNNLGGKTKKTLSNLRCKKSVVEALKELCPRLTNLKARVQDTDVEHLSILKNLNSVELVFNVGRPTTPALGTMSFLQAQGANLTSVALICSSISMVHVQTLGKCCPNLSKLWLRSNHFQVARGSRESLPDDVPAVHDYFCKLKIFYFRVGEGELALSFVPPYVIEYLLRNAHQLTEFTLALRSYIINDDYICGLLIDCNLYQLEKLLIVVPGLNNMPKVLPLTMRTVSFVIDFCPRIAKLGNLLSWDLLESDEYKILKSSLKSENVDLDLICRHMVMH